MNIRAGYIDGEHIHEVVHIGECLLVVSYRVLV